jgi:hypothetical protein
MSEGEGETPLIANLKKQYEGWDKQQLIDKLVNYDLMWQSMDDQSKFFLENVYQLWRAVKRDYTDMIGFLTKVYFSVEAVELQVEEKRELYGENKIRVETKTVTLSPKSVLWLEVLRNVEEIPKGGEQK